jgi:hypothetical protein
VPQPIATFLSVYRLFALGMHGGHALYEGGLAPGVVTALVASMAMAFLAPVHALFVLRVRIGVPDAAALAATYGSIGVVTFVTAGPQKRW